MSQREREPLYRDVLNYGEVLNSRIEQLLLEKREVVMTLEARLESLYQIRRDIAKIVSMEEHRQANAHKEQPVKKDLPKNGQFFHKPVDIDPNHLEVN